MTFQVGSALLDACVLAILQKEDAYGYILTQNLKEIISVSESTLYPILRRLLKESCLTAYDEPYSGRNRRYYRITDLGRETLEGYKGEWKQFKVSMDHILFGGAQDEEVLRGWKPDLVFVERGRPSSNQAMAPTPGKQITATAHSHFGALRTRAGSA